MMMMMMMFRLKPGEWSFMFGAITFLEFIEFVFIFIVSQFSSDDITLCFVIVVTTLTE